MATKKRRKAGLHGLSTVRKGLRLIDKDLREIYLAGRLEALARKMERIAEDKFGDRTGQLKKYMDWKLKPDRSGFRYGLRTKRRRVRTFYLRFLLRERGGVLNDTVKEMSPEIISSLEEGFWRALEAGADRGNLKLKGRVYDNGF